MLSLTSILSNIITIYEPQPVDSTLAAYPKKAPRILLLNVCHAAQDKLLSIEMYVSQELSLQPLLYYLIL